MPTATEGTEGSVIQAYEAWRKMSAILTYHKVGRQLELGITSVTRKRFSGHLDVLKSLGAAWVTASDAVLNECEAGAIALTFDDGYESVYTEALPEMLCRQLTGTVFVVVGAVGGVNNWDVRLSLRPFRHLSWSQIEDLARRGFEIGSHTLSHRDLTRLSDRDLARELEASRSEIQDRLGREVRAIAYPFGKTDRRVIDAAQAAGYRCGFVSSPRTEGRMAVGRMSVYAMDGARSLRGKMGAAPGHMFEVAKTRIISQLSRGTPLVKR